MNYSELERSYGATVYDTFRAAISEHDSPEDIADLFQQLSEIVTDENYVADRWGHETTPDSVGCTPVFDGSLGIAFGDDATLSIDYRWWVEAPAEDRLVYLLHELTHFKVAGHPQEFFEEYLRLYTEAKTNPNAVEACFEEDFDWELADWLMVSSPTENGLRSEPVTVEEKRRELAEKLGYDTK